MKGRTLEELDELFQNRVSVREFSKYECVSSERAKERVKDASGTNAARASKESINGAEV